MDAAIAAPLIQHVRLQEIMARVIKKPGDIFKIPLSKGNHAYVQWLSDGTVRVFKAAYDSDVIIDEIIELPVAFRVVVYRDTPGRYGWIKIGKASIPEEFAEPQHYAKKDILTGKLSIWYQDKGLPATEYDVRGLETLAVWAHPHIVERLEAELDGRESACLKSVSVLA